MQTMRTFLQNLFVGMCKAPILGDLLTCCLYVFVKAITFVVVWISRGRRLRYGTSVIATPKEQSQAIQDGVERLRKCDPEMFSRFSRRRLNIAYSSNRRGPNNGGLFYILSERYIKLGAEGVAAFIVQCTLLAEASPSINRFRITANELAALKIALRKVLEWMQQHSFHPGLINSYTKVVEKWEAGKRFKAL